MDIVEFRVIALALFSAMIGILLIRVVRTQPRITRLCGRVSGFLLTTSGLLAFALLLLSERCTVRLTPVVSPDGRHAATVESLNGGATEPWHTSVTVRSCSSFRSRIVFSSEDDPQTVHLNWVSNSHLLIRTQGNPQQPVD